MLKFYKYQGSEGNYLMIDGRTVEPVRFRKKDVLHALCIQNDTDGVTLILESGEADFLAAHYGRDGLAKSITPDAGRCAVAFADVIGIKAFHSTEYCFENEGVVIHAEILSHLGECKRVAILDGARRIEDDTLNLGDIVE